jgi:hypothetical protein
MPCCTTLLVYNKFVVHSRALGSAIEAVVLAACGGDAELASRRPLAQGSTADLKSDVLAAVRMSEQAQGDVAERVAAGLRALTITHLSQEDADLLLLLDACWNGQSDPALAKRQIEGLLARRTQDESRLAR